MDFLMGEYGMAYQEARRVPHAELAALWRASARRLARSELRLIEDLYAVAGLQSEVRVEGERPKKGKRSVAVTLNRRREELKAEGYPMRRKPYDPDRDLKRIQAFFAGATEVPVITPDDDKGGAT